MTELVRPSLERYDAWVACRRDFGDDLSGIHGDGHWNLPTELQTDLDRGVFEAFVPLVLRFQHESVAGHLIPTDFMWITEGEEIVGFIRISHRLEGRLLDHGHIGYSIRPSRRREGHASRALALALAHCRGLGIERVLVCCAEDNVASERTIVANGGVYESTRDGYRRFWIPLS
jgi:predicted acetyltransferase